MKSDACWAANHLESNRNERVKKARNSDHERGDFFHRSPDVIIMDIIFFEDVKSHVLRIEESGRLFQGE